MDAVLKRASLSAYHLRLGFRFGERLAAFFFGERFRLLGTRFFLGWHFPLLLMSGHHLRTNER